MSRSPGPPPWPLPPSWTLAPPWAARKSERTVALLGPSGDGPGGVVADVTVDVRPSAAPAGGFAGVYGLAEAAAQAFGDGAHGVVIGHRVEAPAETAWALDLLHPGDAPLVLAASGADVADAIAVAAAVPRGSGCLLVARGEVHAASVDAGPMGHVTGGTVRLLWRAPERRTVRGPHGGRSPRAGLYTVGLGDDGEPLRAVAGSCDGLVVAASGPVPEPLGAVLAETAARIPVVLASPHDGPMTTTSLDPLKARVLMYLLLDAGRDRDAVLKAFTTPGPAEL
jgi:L-asparaginase